jgi:arabinogalactan endo-1,4-beta-galactosidase
MTGPLVHNPGFESELSSWNSTGSIESGGHSGQFRLTHGAGTLETTQVLTGVPNGWHTLRTWVRSNGEPAAYVALKDCGGKDARAAVPIVGDDWLQIVVSARVTNHRCTISLYSEAGGGAWVGFDDIEFVPGRAALSVMGADISSLIKSEDMGGIYAYEDGTPGDALEILSGHGLNYARIRVWVNSPDGYHGKAQLLEIARRL